MQNIDPGFLVVAIVFAVVSIDGFFFRRLFKLGQTAAGQGDYKAACKHRERLYRSNLLTAWICRLTAKGYLDMLYADVLVDGGRPEDALPVVRRGLLKARNPVFVRSLRLVHALACAKLGDEVGLDEQLAALTAPNEKKEPLPDIAIAVIMYSLLLVGRLEEAERMADARLAQRKTKLQRLLFGVILHTFYLRGRFPEVIRLFADETYRKPKKSGGSTLDDDLGVFAAIQANDRAAMFQAAITTLGAASELGQVGVYDKITCDLSHFVSNRPREQMQAHGVMALRMAYDGNADEVASLVATMDRLVAKNQDDVHVAEHRRLFLFEAYFVLRDYERALCFSHVDPRLAEKRIVSSQAHALRAKCLAALGQAAEAEAELEEARRLLSGAFWCRADYKEHVGHPWVAVAEAVDESVEVEVVDEPEGVATEAMMAPVAPVASRSCWWVWGLAVFAFMPFLGVVASLGMLIPALMLLLSRRRLAHDRRVGVAGLVIGAMALLIGTASFVVIVKGSGASEPYVSGVTIQSFERERLELDTAERMSAGYGVVIMVVLLVSLTLHEVGHALAAYWSGDPTAKDLGRITLNPIRHLSLFGSVILPLVLYLMPGDGFIGWAKPVPVNPARYRKWRAGSAAVGIAGVAMNFFVACVFAVVMGIVLAVIAHSHPGACISNSIMPFTKVMVSTAPGIEHADATLSILKAGIWINAFLMVFNLMPIPPLDGFGLLRVMVPRSWAAGFGKLQALGMLPLLIVVALGGIQFLVLPAGAIGGIFFGFLHLLAGNL